ncbi:MAG: PIN domain protein [Candidatus Competibacteraceae bacterium]
MLIYLDICCFNRPFDDQSQTRIRFENPFSERAASILLWRNLAEVRVGETASVLDRGRSLMPLGIKPFDALHVACAMIAGTDLFITIDDALLRKLRGCRDLSVLPPGDALAQLEYWYED